MSIFKRPLSYVEENCGNMPLWQVLQRHKFADILRNVQFVLRSRTLLILHVCA